MKPFRFLAALFAAPAVLTLSSLAHALAAPDTAACGNGPACAFGFECTVVASSGCGPTPACAPGASCPDPAPCVDTQEYGCAPAHCQANTDCASDMVCHEWTEDCADTECVCGPGEKCDCGEPTTCDPKAVSMCTPRYVLPCSAAADCGPGFTCEETESCGCSGSGGAETPPSPGSGAAPLPPGGGGAPAADAAPIPPDCSCEPSGVKQCVPQEIGCDNDAACPAGWACEEGEVDSPPPCVDGNCASRPAPLPPTKTCQPPYYRGVDRDLDDPVPPQAGGDGEGTSNGVPPNSGNPTDEGSNETQESSACQFGPASGSGGALSLVAVLGALFGVVRRRRVK